MNVNPFQVSSQRKMWASDEQTCPSSIYGPSSPSSNSFPEESTSSPNFYPTFPSLPPPPPSLHHDCVATLKGHNSYTSALVLAGEYLFTGSSSGQISCHDLTSLLDLETLSNSTSIVAGEGVVKAIAASKNDMLITAHQDHKIRAWKLDNSIITHVATLPTLSDRAVKLLLPKSRVQITRHKKSTWVHHVDAVSAIELSKDGSLLYSVSWDRTLKVWRTRDFKCLESVANAHEDAINAVALSGDRAVYTGSSDRKIKVWRKKEGDKTHSLDATLVKHKAGINALAMSTDGTVLYSGASDRTICVWRAAGGGGMAAAVVLKGHAKSVLCLATAVDFVCSGSADQTVRIWRGSGKSYSCLAVLEGHRGPIKCLTVAFDHSSSPSKDCLLYSASLDCDIKVWKLSLSI